jgi:hypothetical protein
MGAWGIKALENDTALDWAAGLTDEEDASIIEEALDVIEEAGVEEIDASEAEEALAACEVVALLQGNKGNDFEHEEVEAWVKIVSFKVSNELSEKAQKTIDRILTQPSELYDLWEESDDFEDWETCMADLKQRVMAKS